MQEGPHHQGNGEVPPMFTYTNRPVTLKFVDVGYRVKLGNKTSGATEKVILKGVTGIVRQGEMLAMLGPSGSGKTTLLTALGGRLRGHLSGAITYNDKPLSKAMIRNTGFVTQDDILYAHLTVTETLVFTARLRLPRSITKEEKVRQAMSVISLLGLTNCKDNIIGNALVRGVSGGERKRVSIGQEMLINPSLLFLDEPTSGLDSTTAQTIVSTLGKLAAAGRTVVMTIHQPSSRIFYMFHNILLLSNGHPIYYGKSSEALDYFNGVGFGLSVPMNPADFLLDVANGISSDGSAGDREKVNQTLVRAYNDNIANKLKTQIQEAEVENTGSTNDKEISRWSTTWWEEFSVLLQRGVKEKRYSSFSGLRLGQMAFVTLLVGLLWYKSKAANVQDRAGLLFFYTTFWILVPMFQSIFTFPQERLMLTKERSSGMYRLSSYFMATTAGDLPMELVLPTIFITVTYWMAGLKPSLPAFLETLFVLLFCVIVAQGLGLALGALIMDHKAATTLGSICSLTFLLSGSYYVQHAPVFISWIKYISPTHYTYSLLLDGQYSANETYQCGPHKICLVRDIPFVKRVGLGHKTSSILALCGMLVFFRLLAYLALTRIKATR